MVAHRAIYLIRSQGVSLQEIEIIMLWLLGLAIIIVSAHLTQAQTMFILVHIKGGAVYPPCHYT